MMHSPFHGRIFEKLLWIYYVKAPELDTFGTEKILHEQLAIRPPLK